MALQRVLCPALAARSRRADSARCDGGLAQVSTIGASLRPVSFSGAMCMKYRCRHSRTRADGGSSTPGHSPCTRRGRARRPHATRVPANNRQTVHQRASSVSVPN